jgi:hypothetical protein
MYPCNMPTMYPCQPCIHVFHVSCASLGGRGAKIDLDPGDVNGVGSTPWYSLSGPPVFNGAELVHQARRCRAPLSVMRQNRGLVVGVV